MRRVFVAAVAALFLVIVLAMGLARSGGTVILVNPLSRITPSPTPTPKTVYTFMLLGMGGANHDGGELTDTMLLASVNVASRSAVMVNIPRDAWVELHQTDGQTQFRKVNAAYYYGGVEEVKRLTEMITGIRPDYYVAIDFGGFARLVDLIGGIDVDVPMSFVDELYPITGKEADPCGKTPEEIKAITSTMSGLLVDTQFPCRYERLEFTKGRTHMDGATALKFVRSRHSAVGGGDFARAQRQQAVIVAVRNKLLTFESMTKLGSLAAEANRSIKTDADIGTGLKLAPQLSDWKNFAITNVVLSTENVLSETFSADRQYILLPKDGSDNWASVAAYVKDKGADVWRQK